VATTTATVGVLAPPSLARPSRSLLSNDCWKLRRDKLTICAFIILLILGALSLAAPLFSDYLFHYRF